MVTATWVDEASGIARRRLRERPPLSQVLWQIDWRDELPVRVGSGEGVIVRYSGFERALPFIERNYAAIFEEGEGSPFSSGSLTEKKLRYYREVADFFEFEVEGGTVALLVCTPLDWSTYYIRSAASLPEYQGKSLIQRFLPRVFTRLAQAGVERVEAHTSPANMATMHLLTRLRFNVTGTVLTERWGAQVHFTKFLDPPSEATFLHQFCAGVKYQLGGRGGANGTGY